MKKISHFIEILVIATIGLIVLLLVILFFGSIIYGCWNEYHSIGLILAGFWILFCFGWIILKDSNE